MARPMEFNPETHSVLDDDGDIKPEADFLEPVYEDPFANPRKDDEAEEVDRAVEAQERLEAAEEPDITPEQQRYDDALDIEADKRGSYELGRAELARRGFVRPE